MSDIDKLVQERDQAMAQLELKNQAELCIMAEIAHLRQNTRAWRHLAFLMLVGWMVTLAGWMWETW